MAKMEDVLAVYQRPYDPKRPQVLQFSEYAAVQVPRQAGEFDEEGIADGVYGQGEEDVRVHGAFTFRNGTRIDTEFTDLKTIFEGQTTRYHYLLGE